ncbi:MAG: phosphatidylinositol kinase [Acidobacteria bacterium]|nr:phosphatidylinositol kinase [Acidobacteriota bacterium]
MPALESGNTMAKRAVEHLRRMRGGAQSHLMRCEDDHYYVVKFQTNPQGARILANEMLAGRLALALGLPVTEPEVIEVSDWLVEHSPEMYLQYGNDRVRCPSGLQFGSRFPCDPLRTPVYDFLPDTLLDAVENRSQFAGMLVFDKWTCNCDSRQLVFHRSATDASRYSATMIDQGYCFNAAEWNFPDAPMRGLYGRLAVYSEIAGLESFEPYLARLLSLDEEILEEAASRVPPEWYGARAEELGALLDALMERRQKVAPLILACQRSDRKPFPNWKDGGKS